MADKPKDKSLPINEFIKFPTLNVIDDDGQNLGVMTNKDALLRAQGKNLDLVLISFKNGVAIAKILDYGKFKYEQKRKAKDSRKNQTIIKNKEIKVKPLIGEHDLMVRANNAIKWLNNGDRVLFIIESYGRMASKPEFVTMIYDKFINLIGSVGKIGTEMKQVTKSRYETIIVPAKSK